jgi:MFS superfamily sulfate permease-like transporter
VIAVGQLDKILGVETEGGNVLQELGSMLEQFSDWNWAAVAVGAAALAALFLIEEFAPKIPGALVVMLTAIAVSAIFGFEDAGIEVVGEIPAQLPSLSIPEWPGWDIMSDVIVGALAVIVVAFAESFAAAKTYASKFGYQVDANQEMIGLGAANLGAGLSGGFVVDGSLSKTAAGVGAGQKTQMTSIITAVFVLITIVALTWMFEPLPEAVLGAIVIHAVWKLIDFSGFAILWQTRKIDFGLAIAAFLGVILIDILQGIVIGIILSLVALIYRASFPEGAELGRIEDDDGNYEFVGVANYPDARTLPGMVIYRQTGSLIFSNASAFSKQARELLWNRTDPPASVLLVDCEQMADMDTTGAEEIISLNEELEAVDVELWLTRLHGNALVTAERAGVINAIGEDRVMATIRLAGQTFRSKNPDIDPGGGERAS